MSRARLFILAFVFAANGCATKQVLKVDGSESMFKNQEYEKALEVKSLPDAEGEISDEPPGAYILKDAPPYVLPPSVQAEIALQQTTKKAKAKAAPKPVKNASVPVPVATPARRQPEIESDIGFEGRRPKVDPFRVGEAVTLELSYFGMVAGDMTLEVRPFKQVNGRKSYHFAGVGKSNSIFAMFYAIDDWVETFVDFEDMVPYNYSLNVKETKQLREVKSYFDWHKLKGYAWDKKVTQEKGLDEKKYEWKIQPFSHNVFSAPFYIRAFDLQPGRRIQFRIGHEGKNLLLTADVLRRETIQTKVGELKTLVVRPKIEIDGVFKPMGEVLFWLTDDDRKFIVRLESKIKIGTVIGKVKSIKKGE